MGTTFVVASLASPRMASAQQATSDVRLEWQAPAGCPSGEAVREAIVRSAAGTGPIAARVVVTRADAGYTALTRIEGPGWVGERRLEAGDCTQLSDAIALIVALSMTSRPSLSGPSAGEVPSTAGAPPAEAAPPQEPSPEAPAPEARRPAPEAPPETGLRSRTLTAAVSAVAELGPLPALGAGAALSLTYRHRSLTAGAQVLGLAPRDADASPGVGGHLSFFAAVGRVAVEARTGAFDLGPAAGVEVDILDGTGYGSVRTWSNVASFAALTAGAHVTFWPTGRLGIRLDPDAVLPLARPTFAVEGVGTVYRSPALFGRASLGLEMLLF